MNFKEGDKVVIKTYYTNGDKARTVRHILVGR